MGAWSAAINGTDEFMEVYEDFEVWYSDYGEKDWLYTTDQVRQKLDEDFESTLKDEQLSHDYFFALALRYWEYGIDDKDVADRVKRIIESGDNLTYWKSLDADEKLLSKRKKVLDDFLKKISAPNPRPKARKKIKRQEPLFHSGDLLTFQMGDLYYAAVTTGDAFNKHGEFVLHLLNYRSSEKPSREILLETEFMKIKFEYREGIVSEVRGFHFKNKDLKASKVLPEKIGEVKFHEFGYYADGVSNTYSSEKITEDFFGLAEKNYKKEGYGGQMLLKYYTDPYHLNEEMISMALNDIRAGKPFDIVDTRIDPSTIYFDKRYSSPWIAMNYSNEINIYETGNILCQVLGPVMKRKGLQLYKPYIRDYKSLEEEAKKLYVTAPEYFQLHYS